MIVPGSSARSLLFDHQFVVHAMDAGYRHRRVLRELLGVVRRYFPREEYLAALSSHAHRTESAVAPGQQRCLNCGPQFPVVRPSQPYRGVSDVNSHP
jgi:hypothetical protein